MINVVFKGKRGFENSYFIFYLRSNNTSNKLIIQEENKYLIKFCILNKTVKKQIKSIDILELFKLESLCQ